MEKIKELSEHGMIWTDEDGFLLKPLGTYVWCFMEFEFQDWIIEIQGLKMMILTTHILVV